MIKKFLSKRYYSVNSFSQIKKQELPVYDVIDLAFSKTTPNQSLNGNLNKCSTQLDKLPVFVNIHGILGNRLIFNSINKKLANTFNADVYSVDLRNHGNSLRAQPYDYLTMTKDIIHFIEKNIGINRPINIIGFSAGGKIAMLTALNNNLNLNINKILVIDNSPNYTKKLDNIFIDNYNLIMKFLNNSIKVKKNSIDWKQKVKFQFDSLKVNSPLTSLYFSSGFTNNNKNNSINDINNEYIEYKIPLDSMPKFVEEIKAWPDLKNCKNYKLSSNVPICFFKALKSPIMTNDYDSIKTTFSSSKITEFNTGHNILMEDSESSLNHIIKFFK